MTELTAANISASIGRRKILDSVTVSFGAGELVGLIGPNGAGKTSLLKCLLGLMKADSGVISLDGQPLTTWSRSEVARRLGYLPQGAPCHWPMTAKQIIELGWLPNTTSNLAARFCSRLILMDRGRIVTIGTPNQVLVPEQLTKVYKIDVALQSVDGHNVVDYKSPQN